MSDAKNSGSKKAYVVPIIMDGIRIGKKKRVMLKDAGSGMVGAMPVFSDMMAASRFSMSCGRPVESIMEFALDRVPGKIDALTAGLKEPPHKDEA